MIPKSSQTFGSGLGSCSAPSLEGPSVSLRVASARVCFLGFSLDP